MTQLGGVGQNAGRVAASDEDGNIYLLGGYEGTCYYGSDTIQGGQVFIAKINPAGNLIWLQTCNSPSGSLGLSDLAIDTISQSIYVVGTYQTSCTLDTVNLVAGNFAAGLLSKWNYAGSCIWAKNVATSGTDLLGGQCYMRTLALSSSGQIVVSGATTEFAITHVNGQPYPFGSFLAAYDPNGTPLWDRTFATHSVGQNASVVDLDGSGDLVYAYTPYGLYDLTDSTQVDTILVTGPTHNGYFLARLNATTGGFVWLEQQRDNGYSLLTPLTVDAQGRPVVVGRFKDPVMFNTDTLVSPDPSVFSGYIAIYDSTGTEQHLNSFHSSANVYLEDIIPDGTGGGLYMTGRAFPGSGNWNGVPFNVVNFREVFVSHLNEDGTCQSLFTDGSGLLSMTSGVATDDGLYLSLHFPDFQDTGTVALGSSTYSTYGQRDAIIAKLDHVTSVSSVQRSLVSEQLLIYANPNNGLCTVELPESLRFTPGLMLAIYDMQGRQVQRVPVSRGSDGMRLDISAEARGMYHVELSDGDQRYSGTIVFE